MTWHLIAESIGCSVNEAKQKITSQEFLDWLSFYEINPPIRDFINYSQANICRTIVAVNTKKGKSIPRVKKFMLDFKEAAKTKTQKTIDGIHKFFGGNVKNGTK
jgi:hypothetical protein